MTRKVYINSLQWDIMRKMHGSATPLTTVSIGKMIEQFLDWRWIEDAEVEMSKGPFGLTEPVDKTVRRILGGDILKEDMGVALRTVVRRDMYMATKGKDDSSLLDDTIYRVSIYPDGVDILCLGMESIDSQIDGHYDRVDDLPDWVQERLAVLMIMDATPPTTEVGSVGRRISAHVYWVYSPDRPRAEPSACGTCV
jgi:hypothetical protein